MNATPTRPDEAPRLPGLDRLIEMLREAQLPVGPSEVIDAAQVLQHLASSVPASEQERSRLKPRLRPALCKSIVDQAVFDDVFERWSALPAEGSGTASIPAAAGAARPSTLRGPAPGVVVTKRSRWHRWAAAATLLAAIAAAAWWYSRPAPIPPAAAPVKASSAPVAPAAPTAVAPDASQTRDPNAITVYGYFPALRANEEIRPFWLWALLLLPLLGIAPALLLALPLPRISRRRGGGSMTLQAWPASKHQRDLVFRIAPAVEGQLQRHVRGAVEHREAYARRPLLDARRTVEATIGRLGVPSPRYRYARLRPAYLVLVQAESVDEYAVLWAQRLRTLDMRVDIFRFGAPIDGAAPRCVEVGGAGRRFGFDALPNPEPGQRLMLLAPTAALLGTDDRLHPWARAARLKRWAQRALFTPDEPRDWNLAHVNALEQPTGADPGMFVLPFDDNALAAWTEWLVRDHLPDIVLSEPQRYPRLLHDGEARFVGAADAAALGETPQAAGKLVSQLVSQLHAYLGDNGFYWLCACAVPPLLKRQLALLLGEQYFLRCQASEERTRYYMARNWRLLVRLPWLRDDAQIPQWLRLALLARLPETIQDELRDVVRGVLAPQPGGASAATPGSGVQLGFEVPGAESAALGDPSAPATDPRHSLYVGFVRDGLTAEQLVLRIPGDWNRWLPALLRRPPWWRRLGAGWARWSLRDGIAGQGFSGLSVLFGALAAVAGGLGWAVLALIQPVDWPAAARGWIYDEVLRTVAVTHQAAVTHVAYSRDGSRFVTASRDNTARVWDADTGKPVGEPMKHASLVNSASFSPDGRRVVTASQDDTARVWDAGTGKPVGVPMTHRSPVNSASFSPDGRRVVTASADKAARVWDADSGKSVGAPMTHGDWVSSASFSPDGRRVVTASGDKTARVWDADTGKPVGEPMTHGEIVASAGFSPDGKRVVTASWDKTAHVWDADSGKPVGESMTHGAPVISASFNFDGKRVVTASADKTARVWDAGTGKPVSEPMAHGDAVNTASFSPDGKRVVTASWDNTARVWEAGSGTPLGPALKHDSVVTQGAFSPDGSRVATVSQDGAARVWNAASGALIGVPLQTAGEATHVDWSPDGQRLVIATGVQDQSSPSGSTGGGWSERNSADGARSAAAVAQSPPGLHAAQRLKANAAYVVRVPQLPPPPYPGQGGVDRLRELIDTRIETNVGAIAALVGLSAAMALVVAWRQRRQLVSLRPGGTA